MFCAGVVGLVERGPAFHNHGAGHGIVATVAAAFVVVVAAAAAAIVLLLLLLLPLLLLLLLQQPHLDFLLLLPTSHYQQTWNWLFYSAAGLAGPLGP